jgi:hypothetical protein
MCFQLYHVFAIHAAVLATLMHFAVHGILVAIVELVALMACPLHATDGFTLRVWVDCVFSKTHPCISQLVLVCCWDLAVLIQASFGKEALLTVIAA